jgi:hypothetical protein
VPDENLSNIKEALWFKTPEELLLGGGLPVWRYL